MLPELIQKLAHEVAENWAAQALQFSAADQMGRSLAQKLAAEQPQGVGRVVPIEKEALGLVGKGLMAAGAIGTGIGAVKGVGAMAKRHKEIQSRPYQHGMSGPAHFRVSRQM
jgi:hypothetical protein